jgi:hypothetical protein
VVAEEPRWLQDHGHANPAGGAALGVIRYRATVLSRRERARTPTMRSDSDVAKCLPPSTATDVHTLCPMIPPSVTPAIRPPVRNGKPQRARLGYHQLRAGSSRHSLSPPRDQSKRGARTHDVGRRGEADGGELAAVAPLSEEREYEHLHHHGRHVTSCVRTSQASASTHTLVVLKPTSVP